MSESDSSDQSQTVVVSSAASSSLAQVPHLEALEMVKTPITVTLAISFLLLLIVGSVTAAMFLPWRQSVTGSGKIIVFSPMHRPQSIEAQIPGRLLNWYVRDGQMVRAGQLIARLAELDARFLDDSQLRSLNLQKDALVARREAAEIRIKALKQQVQNSSGVQSASVPAAKERLNQADERIEAAEQAVEAANQTLQTAEWQVERITSLFDSGLRSKRDKELAELDKVRAQTGLQIAKVALDVAKKDADIARLESHRVVSDSSGTINSVQASVADANQVIASTDADIYHIDIDIKNLMRRVQQREVAAPCDGRIVRLMRVGAGETVNAGEVLAVIAPQTEDRAAEVNIRDWDAPLISIGNPVRLQIAGWPALQFIGWPRVAIGTFAGKVAVIDAVDDGKGRYRIIVVPDEEAIKQHKEEHWPATRYLRPGAQVTGWVLLSDVPLWYELWRQFNGWQPTIHQPPETPDTKPKDKHQKSDQ
ncbi:MAG: HlyD family secretion protein [Cyanobacteria bacterium]|nr:HlyD family secretion protein [Cyanobacteriota bacterium]